MPRWPHDDPASLAAYYGDPETGAPGKQLVPVAPPFTMYYAGKAVPHIMFHRKAAPALTAALDDIWRACGRNQATVDRLRISAFSGAYNPRYVRGYEPGNPEGRTPRWSNHAYGAAIDFDADHNGFNTGHGTMPQLVIDAFKRQGALWGGDYQGRTDPMHFEFCSREAASKPATLMDVPQTDGDTDGDAAPPAVETPPASPSAGGFFGRLRNWIVTSASGVGLTGLGALTNGEVVAMLLGFVLLIIVGSFLVALWLWGKQNVADWIARHIA
ncbi:hypothetical protein ACVWW6_005515 [Bradyrhizobium sp. USDA 3311]